MSATSHTTSGALRAAKEDDGFAAFCARFGDEAGQEVMERIADAGWNRKGDGVSFKDIHQINACNHVYSGVITHAGEDFGFIIESGDIHGTLIREWGAADEIGTYQSPAPTLYTFAPADDELKQKRPELYGVYLAWRKTDWFRDKERGYNYDRHFAPGGKTEDHYRAWAASKGMKIVPADVLTDEDVSKCAPKQK